MCLYFIIDNTETIAKALRLYGEELERGGEGATPWTLLWGHHVHQFKVKGEGDEKKVCIKSPSSHYLRLRENMKKRNESSSVRFQRQTVGRY